MDMILLMGLLLVTVVGFLVGCVLAIILPSGVASIAVFYCAVRRAVNLSEAYFAMTVTNENRLGLKNEAADYTSAFFISILIIAIISAMRCLIICLLAG